MEPIVNVNFLQSFAYPSPESDYGFSTSSSPESIMSPPAQEVPNHYLYNVNHDLRLENNGLPFLKITEQPLDKFRFRYKSEMSGTHGCIFGRSKKKCYPTVELKNYNKEATIMCTLSQVDTDVLNYPDPHPHKLVKWRGSEEVEEPHFIRVPNHSDYSASFSGLSILYTGRKFVMEEMVKKIQNIGYNKSGSMQIIESEVNNINYNSVRLRFDAYDVVSQKALCAPVFSEHICNQKSAETCQLRIVNTSRCRGSCNGYDSVLMFVEKVNKKNIKIRFFEVDEETGDHSWEDFAIFTEMDVHHQYGISFRTPPYKNKSIQTDVKVYVELYRPKDGARSNKIEFIYTPSGPERNTCKRSRSNDYDLYNSNHRQELPMTISAICEKTTIDECKELELSTCLHDSLDVFLQRYLGNGGIEETEFENISHDSPLIPKKNVEPDVETNTPENISTSNFNIMLQLVKHLKVWSEDASSTIHRDNVIRILKTPLEHSEYAIHILVRYDLKSVIKNIVRLFKYLLSFDAIMINKQNASQDTPLHIAVNGNLLAVTESILELGADPNVFDKNGNTPLHLCTMAKENVCFDSLLRYNKRNLHFGFRLDLDSTNTEGKSPLHIAAINGSLIHVIKLLKAGAVLNKISVNSGKTALHYCIQNGHMKILEYLVRHEKLDIDEQTYEGYTALHYLCNSEKNNGDEMCKYLLDAGANPFIKCGNTTPWERALLNKLSSIITLIKNYYPDHEDLKKTSQLISEDGDFMSVEDTVLNHDALKQLVQKVDSYYLFHACEKSSNPLKILINDPQNECEAMKKKIRDALSDSDKSS